MIKFASKNQIPHLKKIWKECFDDSDEGINYFFDNRFNDKNTLIWEEKGLPVSMLVLLPATVYYDDNYIDIKYIYAVSTLKEYRNKGFSSKLLEYANSMYETVLIPAESELFDFYKNRGYNLSFCVKIAEFDVKDNILNSKISISDITYQKYKEIRDKIFLKYGYVLWDFKAVKYALGQNKIYGGKACQISVNENNFAVMYRKDKETLIVREAAVKNKYIEDVLKFLAVKEGCTRVKAILLPNSTLEGNIKEFGLSTMDYIKNGYINLVLD